MRDWRERVLYGAMWVYSGLHFLVTGVIAALGSFQGDFLAAFPTPTFSDPINPALFQGSLAAIWLKPSQWSYGPVMYLVTYPLLYLPSLQAIYRVWLVINYGFLVVAFVYLFRLSFSGPRRSGDAAIFGFMVLNYYPLYEALLQRNIEILEILLLVASMTMYVRRHDRLAGSLVGLAAMTKFLPAIFLPYFALKRRWAAFAAGIAVAAVLAIWAEYALGWRNNIVLLMLVRDPALGTEQDQSVAGAIRRLANATGLSAYTWMATLWVNGVLALIVAAAILRFRTRGHWKIEWSILIVAMIMLIPHNQSYYLAFLLIPYTLMAGMIREGELRGRGLTALLTTSFLLTGWPVPLSLFNALFQRSEINNALLRLSVPVVGVALLGIVLLMALSRTAIATDKQAAVIVG